MSDDTRTHAAPPSAPENETPAAEAGTPAPGGLTLSRPGEAAPQNIPQNGPQNGPQNIPQARRGKRAPAAPTGGEGIPAGTNGRLRIIHN